MISADMVIGWIGAGKMGLPICRRLQLAGHKVRALARSDAAASRLAAAGLEARSSIREIASSCEIVFSAISDDAALEEIVSGEGGLANCLKPGSTAVDISTVSPAASARAAALLNEKHIAFLRSPVSGSTLMAEAGSLTAIVSGPKKRFEELAMIFAAFTRKAFHVGEAEEARYLKLVLNAMVGATSALLAEALAFGRKGGLDNATMLDVVTQSAVASPLIAYKRDMIVSGDYRAAASLSLLMKDFDILLSEARNAHCPLPLTSMVRQFYEQAFVKGCGEEDFFVLVREFANQAGLPAPATKASD